MNRFPRRPFRFEFDAAIGRLVVWKTFGNPPRQTVRRKAISSLESLAAEVAIDGTKPPPTQPAQPQAAAAVQHLGADPARL